MLTKMIYREIGLLGLLLFLRHVCEAVKFSHKPVDHTVVEGRLTHFTCGFKDLTDDIESQYEVTWTKDSYNISEPGFDMNRFSFHHEYSSSRYYLRINNTKKEDEGSYQCRLHYNDNIVLISNTCILTVREIPQDKYPVINFDKKKYRVGELIVVSCACEKTDPEPELEWELTTRDLLKPTTNVVENETLICIKATYNATTNVNGFTFGCLVFVDDEDAPRVSHSKHLIIINEDLQNTTTVPIAVTNQHTTSLPSASNKHLKVIYSFLGIVASSVIFICILALIKLKKHIDERNHYDDLYKWLTVNTESVASDAKVATII